jgi:hypothetical protein
MRGRATAAKTATSAATIVSSMSVKPVCRRFLFRMP